VRLVHNTGPPAQQGGAKPSQEVTVYTARRINRPAIVCALACALLASATSGTAAARPNQHTHASAALAQERYYSSYGTPQPSAAARERAALAQERYYSSYGAPRPSAAGTFAALAQERYYSSYRNPAPLTAPQPPAPSDDTPWLLIGLSIAAALAIAATSATQLRRLRIRRRRAARVRT
jgi:hypothetical protein